MPVLSAPDDLSDAVIIVSEFPRCRVSVVIHIFVCEVPRLPVLHFPPLREKGTLK